MPALDSYSSRLDYSYAPGFFPAMECLLRAPGLARRVLLSSQAEGTEAGQKLRSAADAARVRVEIPDRALSRISGKENCYAAAVFAKREEPPAAGVPQILLDQPSDCGNLGTILRTALGFGVTDVTLIRPCADVFDPRTVRASMGAIFQLHVKTYDTFEDWSAENPGRPLYPFMLDASRPMAEVLQEPLPADWCLVFGNEGAGLPAAYAGRGRPVRIPSNDRVDSLNLSIAAGIGIFAFTQADPALRR